ncbi:MAG: glycoside hydrolase family 99-like domain-containing protein [Armatimonadetes bacterium]|nr:glycoside hydrolase family 99-like domain-containing protein [Armatimonadota bacterium]
MRFLIPVLLLCGLTAPAACGQNDKTLIEWRFDRQKSLLGWRPNAMVSDVGIRQGALHVRATDWDPFLTGPRFEIRASPWQYIEVSLRATRSGQAEFFWTNTTETEFQGFSTGKETMLDVVGGGKYRTYRIHPFWQGEGKIILLRFDLYDRAAFDIRWIRIREIALTASDRAAFEFDQSPEGWQAMADIGRFEVKDGSLLVRQASGTGMIASPSLPPGAAQSLFMAVRMAVSKGSSCAAHLPGEPGSGTQSFARPLKADGLMHTYNFPLTAPWEGASSGRRVLLSPSDEEGASARIDWIRFGDTPAGPPDLSLEALALDWPVGRTKQPVSLSVMLRNDGGSPARNVRVSLRTAPDVRALGLPVGVPYRLDFGDQVKVTWQIQADRPGRFRFAAEASGEGAEGPPSRIEARIPFAAGLGLPKADYVPEPVPAKSRYHVGIYYFPGWRQGTHWGWDMIRPFPERMPLLGWYNEGNPEAHDWEIKWAAEHGVEFFIFDWYRASLGKPVEMSLYHALDEGFLRARYRHYMKFAVMWENANAQGVADEKDFVENLLPFWIEKYFSLPNYMRIEDKPLLVVYYPPRLTAQLGGSRQVKTAFEKMREACRAAGLNGLYIVADCGDDPAQLQRLAEEGYDATSAYSYIGPGPSRQAKGMTPYDYSEIIDAHEAAWKSKRSAGSLPDFPVLTAGWDPRPWHGPNTWFYWTGNTPARFREMCLRARRLLDATPGGGPESRVVFMEAFNEWGEGSYLAPSRGRGFGYLDAIRSVFTDAPARHADYTPWDVGLGPYEAAAIAKTAWEFDTDGDPEGWQGFMGLSASAVSGGTLKFTTRTRDPALNSPFFVSVRAGQYPALLIRMKADKNISAQLFWSSRLFGIQEAASVKFEVIGDGRFHDYRLDLAKHPRWFGAITGLRLDPADQPDIAFEVDWIRLATGAW